MFLCCTLIGRVCRSCCRAAARLLFVSVIGAAGDGAGAFIGATIIIATVAAIMVAVAVTVFAVIGVAVSRWLAITIIIVLVLARIRGWCRRLRCRLRLFTR